MKCAWCGYIRQKSDDHFFPADECPSCGNLYAKKGNNIPNAFSMEADASEPVIRPSPVDVESLKKARQRVEKRLQGRLAVQKRDSRHDQTLELARQLASEGVRKRQEQWKQQHAALRESDDAQTDPSTEGMTSVDSSTSEPQASHQTTEEADAGVPAAEIATQQDSDKARSASDHTASYLAKAMEKQEKTTHSNDAKEDADEAGADTSEILDMESESEKTIQKSWSVPSREEAEATHCADTPDTEPTLDDQPLTSDAHAVSGSGHLRKRWIGLPDGNLTRLLPLVAWLILVAGISGAILSWTTLSEAKAGMQAHQMQVGNSMNLGLLLGFAYLVTGVLGFALFWVTSLISHQLKDIRRLLLLQPIDRSQSAEAEPKPAAEVMQ